MRAIRKRGWRIKAALRSCPLSSVTVALPGNQTAVAAITGNDFTAALLSLTAGADVVQCVQRGNDAAYVLHFSKPTKLSFGTLTHRLVDSVLPAHQEQHYITNRWL